jgi:drug/metabolite transporter (DMT)-like permease
MLLSAASFALMGCLVKLAGSWHVPLLEIIFVRALISIVLSLWDIARARVHPLGRRRGLLFARGLAGFIALTGVFYAILHLPYAQATVLQYLHPVFTALLAFWFLAESPTRATLACIILSLIGLGWMVSPYFDGAETTAIPLLAITAGLGGALGSGIAYTLVRKLVITEHPSVIVLYFPMVCLPGTLLLGFEDFVWPTSEAWLALIGVGVFTQLGQLSLTRAMQFDSASRTTSLSYLQIVFAALLGWIIFGEVPTTATLMGASLILLGAFISALLQRPRPTAPRP